MPYTITKAKPRRNFPPDFDIDVEAVHTLPEARVNVATWITDRWSSNPHFAHGDDDLYRPETRALVLQAATLPEEGGVIGPCPDDTTIRVKRVTYGDLWLQTPPGGVSVDSEADLILNAFNRSCGHS